MRLSPPCRRVVVVVVQGRRFAADPSGRLVTCSLCGEARPHPPSHVLLAPGDAGRTDEVCRLVGHQSLAMTQRYSHLSPAALDATIRLLENRATLRAVGDSLETPKA